MYMRIFFRVMIHIKLLKELASTYRNQGNRGIELIYNQKLKRFIFLHLAGQYEHILVQVVLKLLLLAR